MISRCFRAAVLSGALVVFASFAALADPQVRLPPDFPKEIPLYLPVGEAYLVREVTAYRPAFGSRRTVDVRWDTKAGTFSKVLEWYVGDLKKSGLELTLEKTDDGRTTAGASLPLAKAGKVNVWLVETANQAARIQITWEPPPGPVDGAATRPAALVFPEKVPLFRPLDEAMVVEDAVELVANLDPGRYRSLAAEWQVEKSFDELRTWYAEKLAPMGGTLHQTTVNDKSHSARAQIDGEKGERVEVSFDGSGGPCHLRVVWRHPLRPDEK